MLEKNNLTPYLNELGYLHDFWPSGLDFGLYQYIMDEIMANLKHCPDNTVGSMLDFCPRGPGFKSSQGHTLFLFPVPFTSLKKLESLDHFLEHLKHLNQTNNLYIKYYSF